MSSWQKTNKHRGLWGPICSFPVCDCLWASPFLYRQPQKLWDLIFTGYTVSWRQHFPANTQLLRGFLCSNWGPGDLMPGFTVAQPILNWTGGGYWRTQDGIGLWWVFWQEEGSWVTEAYIDFIHPSNIHWALNIGEVNTRRSSYAWVPYHVRYLKNMVLASRVHDQW